MPSCTECDTHSSSDQKSEFTEVLTDPTSCPFYVIWEQNAHVAFSLALSETPPMQLQNALPTLPFPQKGEYLLILTRICDLFQPGAIIPMNGPLAIA